MTGWAGGNKLIEDGVGPIQNIGTICAASILLIQLLLTLRTPIRERGALVWQICVDELTQGSLILRCVTISETPFSCYGIYDWIKTFYWGENGCKNKRVRSKRAQQGVRKQGGDQCAALHPGLYHIHRTALRRLHCTIQRTIHREDCLGNLSRAYLATLCAVLAKGLLSLLCTLHTVQCTGQHYTRDWWYTFVRLLPTVSRGTVHRLGQQHSNRKLTQSMLNISPTTPQSILLDISPPLPFCRLDW